MIKHEVKIEFTDSESIKKIVERSYFKDGQLGKIKDKTYYLSINEKDVNYNLLNGLNDSTIKVINENIIDGSMRFLVDESHGDIRLYPISIYCIKDNDKYIFY